MAKRKTAEPRVPALADFRPLAAGRNPNKHTQQGLGQLDAAMSRQGYVAPMTAAADGSVLDGNARLETVATKFPGVAPLVVEHDGTRPVIMVRTDIASADDPLARDIIVSANRIAEVDLAYDLDVLRNFAEDGLDLKPFEFDASMIRDMSGDGEADVNPVTSHFQIVIECRCEAEQVTLLERFSVEGLSCKALVS